ncbi:hypothetical protein ACK36K_14760 [Aeromonas veronii]
MKLAEKYRISVVNNNSFYIFKEEDGLFIHGESLEKWLSIGAMIKDNIIISRESGRQYLSAKISPTFLFSFIFDKPRLFEVTNVDFGYRIKVLQEI